MPKYLIYIIFTDFFILIPNFILNLFNWTYLIDSIQLIFVWLNLLFIFLLSKFIFSLVKIILILIAHYFVFNLANLIVINSKNWFIDIYLKEFKNNENCNNIIIIKKISITISKILEKIILINNANIISPFSLLDFIILFKIQNVDFFLIYFNNIRLIFKILLLSSS